MLIDTCNYGCSYRNELIKYLTKYDLYAWYGKSKLFSEIVMFQLYLGVVLVLGINVVQGQNYLCSRVSGYFLDISRIYGLKNERL